MRRPFVWLAPVGLTVALACTLPAPTYEGKSCETAVDCPEEYACVLARPGLGRTCELLLGPLVSDTSFYPPADWDRDVSPIILEKCAAFCHEATQSGLNGTPTEYLRFDHYAFVDGGVDVGAAAKAASIVRRGITQRTMPPRSSGLPSFTPDEERLIQGWIRAGTPKSLDGGVDAGP